MSGKIIQGSCFEEDYLVRSTGNLATVPDIALTELVANAWDAGASEVHIEIPNRLGGEITVRDNGTGLTPDQFRKRWMTLGYNRLKNQGEKVEFPPDRKGHYRIAYGRNGVGRHGMLCFADRYTVETRKDGLLSKFIIEVTSGKEPLSIVDEVVTECEESHGTTIRAVVTKGLPGASDVQDVISARFLLDPQFRIYVNGKSTNLMDHKGYIKTDRIAVTDDIELEMYVFDSTKTAKTARQHGIAFWVGNRLVGEPSWNLGNYPIDGRTSFARRHTIVVKTEDLYNLVLPDWSGFKISELVDRVYEKVSNYTYEIYKSTLQVHVQKAQETVLKEHRDDLAILSESGKREISVFVEELTDISPTIDQEFLSAAVRAVINLEKSRGGLGLLEKLSKMSEEDVEGLDRLLEEWSVKDALTVIDEIDRRLLVTEALQRLSADKEADELKTLHPLVAQARWLFGPEFDSPTYTSNVSLNQAFQQLFGKKVDQNVFYNHRNRPDLMILEDSTLCAVCTEDFDDASQLSQMKRILIIELKRGGFSIGRDEMNQATGYVEDLMNSGFLDGNPVIHAFVVGHKLDQRIVTSRVRKTGDQDQGRIEAATFSQLVRTAEKRLFKLKEYLSRYREIDSDNLVQKVLNSPQQLKADV